MNERDSTILNDYFNGLLLPEEARNVQARTASDPAFKEEFSLREKMEAFPRQEAEREAFAASLKTLGADFFQENKMGKTGGQPLTLARSNVRRWMALAASITVIATAIWFLTKPSGEPSYRQYAQHAPLSLTVLGNTEQAKTDAEKAFNEKKYALALTSLSKVLADEPDNITAQLYRGICLLELNRAAEARAIFEPMSAGNSAFREEAQWYLALSYLQENNLAACKAELAKIGPDSPHYENAQKISAK